jgi:hypothetical protein
MPGWIYSGDSEHPEHRVIPYSPDAYAVAASVADDLAYYDAQAVVDRADAPDLVLCVRRRGGDWEFLFPGRQLVVGVEGGWRIEAVPAEAVA